MYLSVALSMIATAGFSCNFVPVILTDKKIGQCNSFDISSSWSWKVVFCRTYIWIYQVEQLPQGGLLSQISLSSRNLESHISLYHLRKPDYHVESALIEIICNINSASQSDLCYRLPELHKCPLFETTELTLMSSLYCKNLLWVIQVQSNLSTAATFGSEK